MKIFLKKSCNKINSIKVYKKKTVYNVTLKKHTHRPYNQHQSLFVLNFLNQCIIGQWLEQLTLNT